ncbi:MFS transporter [Micromonospora polyrhachis]|uniref:MFS family permease n=1 Tax=Micromonospora polyrhachis TaxID=1282883 RepID=A0A7W7SP86_9ACTN|nr:MFS transporter [Micromonospora polyrhachis]MBB4958435.1 MFS family permease [Micromonospora polyrhachis]
MPLFSRSGRSALGRTVGTAIRLIRFTLRTTLGGGRWTVRSVGRVREKGAGGEPGMARMFDLHAISCAGDALVAIGLAGTIFFNAPLGEARSKVALYLLVTMVPFALLAPVVGPLLDHFRHGRRWALATTMLGRAFLAWLISDYLHGFGLYPAAFGVLALSRAYGVARSAAVPRLLPAGLGLSQAGARASVYGTIAGGVVGPVGLALFWFGPQWPLRAASVIFLIGMVLSLRLPAQADSAPPEAMPRVFAALFRRPGTGDRALGRSGPDGRLVMTSLVGSATLRAMFGFLLLYLAFALKAGDLTTEVFGRDIASEGALVLVGGALAVGSFLATAAGTRLRIHQPTMIQSSGLVVVAGVAILTAIKFSLPMVALLCLVTAMISGIAKLAVDACIQERVQERLRASAFARSETVLMLAFVAGGALGLIPVEGWIGIAGLAGFATLAAVRATVMATRLRGERLLGRALADDERATPDEPSTSQASADRTTSSAGADVPTPVSPAPASSSGAAPGSTAGSAATSAAASAAGSAPGTTAWAMVTPDEPIDEPPLAPPGFHIYRPSSAMPRTGSGDDESRREPQGPKS